MYNVGRATKETKHIFSRSRIGTIAFMCLKKIVLGNYVSLKPMGHKNRK